MKIPTDLQGRYDLYSEVTAACLASRQRRMADYAIRRSYYLYGSNEDDRSAWNKCYSHLDTVTSFLYASDSTRFLVKLKAGAPSSDRVMTKAFGRRVNEEWKDSNADIIAQQAILWSLVYDSMFMKILRRGSQAIPFTVDPGSFGVYREDIPMLDRQEAFVHVYYITPTDLERSLRFHPKREEIMRNITEAGAKDEISQTTPPILQNVITTATDPNLVGEVNVNLAQLPTYQAVLDGVPVIEMGELWIWNDETHDYQTVTMASQNVCIYDRPNLFMPRREDWEPEHPFTQFCPNPQYDYFWGIAEMDRLIPLQQRRNKRMDDIQRLLEKQVDPPMAWGGMGLPDKLDGFNNAGAQLAISDPAFKMEKFIPQIPQDAYADIRSIDAEFDETSGLTNVLAGRGEAGVRSSGHASKLASLGSSRPKKRALIIEDSLEHVATKVGKCVYLDETEPLHDEAGKPFVPAQMTPHFSVEVDAHSNSPVFMENQRENAVLLLKSKCITREKFIEMLAPPMMEDLLIDLREKIIPQEKAAAQARLAAEAEKSAKGGKQA